jgi:hypothetical protein
LDRCSKSLFQIKFEKDKALDTRNELRATKEKTSLEERAKEIAPIQIGGNFKTFEKVMNQTYKSPIEKVVLLFQRLGGNAEEWQWLTY